MKVHWTDRAKARLRSIHDHIAESRPMAAKPTVARILRRSRQIAELPLSGRKVPEYDQDDLRELLVRPYRVIYRLVDERIDVVAVMHYREILPEDMETL